MTTSFNVYVSKAFDYLSTNTHYKVTQEGRSDMHFKNLTTGSGTTLYKWEVEKAFNQGWLVKE